MKVVHGFEEKRTGCDDGCKNSSRQVYGNINSSWQNLSQRLGIKDYSK